MSGQDSCALLELTSFTDLRLASNPKLLIIHGLFLDNLKRTTINDPGTFYIFSTGSCDLSLWSKGNKTELWLPVEIGEGWSPKTMCNKIRFWSWTERQTGWEVMRRRDITGENKVQWLHLSLLVCYRAAEGEQSLSSRCSRATGFTCSVFIQGISENSPFLQQSQQFGPNS